MSEGGAELVGVCAVGADGLVQRVAGDVELLGPVGDVGGHLGIDLPGVVGALGGVVLVLGVELVCLGCVVVFGHSGFPLLLVFQLIG